VCTEKEILKEYYDEAGKDGFGFAYRFPGMNKVLQSAGRVIRSAQDRGVILLLDDRFLYRESSSLFPREWEERIVTDEKNVGKVLDSFWRQWDSDSPDLMQTGQR
jgi:Rad3-related DNA helicase